MFMCTNDGGVGSSSVKAHFLLNLFLSPLSIATGANLLTDTIHLVDFNSFNTLQEKLRNNLPQVKLCVTCHMLAAVQRLPRLICDGECYMLTWFVLCLRARNTSHKNSDVCPCKVVIIPGFDWRITKRKHYSLLSRSPFLSAGARRDHKEHLHNGLLCLNGTKPSL